MFNFFRKKPKSSHEPPPSDLKRPQWMTYMNDDQYFHFINIVQKYFREIPLEILIDDGVIHVQENDLGLNNLGLSNISQSCARHKIHEYKSLIYNHFDHMQKIHEFNEHFDELKNDYNLVSDYIGVRMIRTETFEVIGRDKMLINEITDDTSSMVIFDLPDSTTNLDPSILKKWNKSEEEIYAIALENCRKNYPFKSEKHNLNGIEFDVFSADHFFSPTVVLYPEILANYVTDYGALVIFPTRHLCIIYTIQDLNVVQAVNSLIAVADGSYKDGPGSLSPKLYWYLPHKFEELPYKMDDGITFTPPKKFVDMMSLLEEGERIQPTHTGPKILPRIQADYNHILYRKDTGEYMQKRLPLDVDIPDNLMPIATRLTADLKLSFAIDTGEAYQILNHDFFRENPSYNLDRLMHEAKVNLIEEVKDKISIEGDITTRCLVTCGGNFEAALLLIDLWDQIHDKMGDEIYLIIPTRDVLFLTAINTENKEFMLKTVKGYFDNKAEFLTSKALYVKKRGSKDLKIVDKAF